MGFHDSCPSDFFDHSEQELLAMDNIFALIVIVCQKALLEGKVPVFIFLLFVQRSTSCKLAPFGVAEVSIDFVRQVRVDLAKKKK